MAPAAMASPGEWRNRKAAARLAATMTMRSARAPAPVTPSAPPSVSELAPVGSGAVSWLT